MLVKTNPGEKCPREDNPRTYITDDPQGVTVPDNAYYRRLVADGSLILVPGTGDQEPAEAVTGSQPQVPSSRATERSTK